MFLYQQVPKLAEKRLGRERKLKSFTLPMPNGLEAEYLGVDDYHRVAVAYGLSYTIDSIGQFISPSEIDDMEPDKPREMQIVSPISKDMV